MGLTNALNAKSFVDVLLTNDPVEQAIMHDPTAEALFGKIAKQKAWGLTNKVPLYMQDGIEMQLLSETYSSFQGNTNPDTTGPGLTNIYANISPISQTARIEFSGPFLERLRELPSSQYLQAESKLTQRFRNQISNIIHRQLMGTKTGALCYAANSGAGTTIYLYGYNGELLPADHILWQSLSTTKYYELCATSTGAPLVRTAAYAWQPSTIVPSTSSITVAANITASGAVGTYVLRPARPVAAATSTTILATQMDGLLNMISSSATYLVDSDGTDITNATYPQWISLLPDFSGQDLGYAQIHQMVASCKGDKSSLVMVADPAVYAKTIANADSKKQFVNSPDADLGFIKTYWVDGNHTIQLTTSDHYRGTGYVDMVNTGHINMMGSILEPKFIHPTFKCKEASYIYFNDLVLSGQIYTDKRNAHCRGTGFNVAY